MTLIKTISKVAGVSALAFALLTGCSGSDQTTSEKSTDSVEETDTIPTDPVVEYGMVTDSFVVHKGQLKKNQFLADLLLPHHISYPEIDKLVKKAKKVFDVRRMSSGKSYAIFCEKDSSQKAACFVYEANSTEYVVFDLRDTMNIYTGEKPVEIREATTSGVITSSLYNSLADAGSSPALAMELSEIYAWSIDFYRIQKNDKFKVIYEEKFVDGEFVGIGEIKAALFNHWNEDYYAFAFKQDSIVDYFDDNAKSLRKAFLQAPLKFSRISSGYTKRRFHPVQKRYKAHLGTDYAAPTGTPIMSVGDGVVIEATRKKYNGKYVKVKHNGTYTTQYLHMSRIADGMKPGKRVRQGDIIGYVGSTGLATGPHVCFRFWKNGEQVDHRKEKLPASKPVEKENMNRYQEEMKLLKEQLDLLDFSGKRQPV